MPVRAPNALNLTTEPLNPFRGPPKQLLKLSSGATGRRVKVSCATDGASERPLISVIAEEFSALVGRTFLWLRFFFSQKEMSSPSGETLTRKLLKNLNKYKIEKCLAKRRNTDNPLKDKRNKEA